MKKEKIYTIEEIKHIINENRNTLERDYSVAEFLLFGSYAKNLQTPQSDIDLLVSFNKTIDMFEFLDLEEYLERLFNKKIDLGTPASLKHFIKDKILKEAIVL